MNTASIDEFFAIRSRGSTLSREAAAGAATFLSLSYIFVVNPAILAEAGMDPHSVLLATIVASASATLVMGLWARLPFALAPGMEMNAYVAFFVVGVLGFTIEQALGAVLISGVIFVALVACGVSQRLIDAIPDQMMPAISLCIGVLLALIAFKITGLVRFDGTTPIGFGDFFSSYAVALSLSVAIVFACEHFRLKGSVLFSIALTSLYCWYVGLSSGTVVTQTDPLGFTLDGIGRLDLSIITDPRGVTVVLVLLAVHFYGCVAKLFGLTMDTPIQENGRLPRMKQALLVDGGATVLGSVLGTTNVTTYVESGVGIAAGGRTGLSAVVCGGLMLSCFMVGPLLRFVPAVATTGALLFVMYKLCPPRRVLKTYGKLDLLVLLVMPLAVIATFSIDTAMLVGFGAYFMRDLKQGRLNSVLLGSVLVLIVSRLLQGSN